MNSKTPRLQMARKNKAQREIANKINQIIQYEVHGVQLDIMDLGKISDEAERAATAGEDITTAVKAIIQKLRKN